jgi:hypothetical protein
MHELMLDIVVPIGAGIVAKAVEERHVRTELA